LYVYNEIRNTWKYEAKIIKFLLKL
jgi:hypothetical protein